MASTSGSVDQFASQGKATSALPKINSNSNSGTTALNIISDRLAIRSSLQSFPYDEDEDEDEEASGMSSLIGEESYLGRGRRKGPSEDKHGGRRSRRDEKRNSAKDDDEKEAKRLLPNKQSRVKICFPADTRE